MTAEVDATDVLPRTGWLNLVTKGWRGCHYCADSLKHASDRGAIYDESGMLRDQRKRVVACERISALVNSSPPLLLGPGYDIYEFGVLTGGGLRAFVHGLQKKNLKFGHLYGFDSFRGLPESDVAQHERSELRDPNWQQGGMNAAETLALRMGDDAFNYTLLRQHIITRVGYPNTTLVRGFYNESLPRLNRRRALRARMQPAMLVDLDCDLYESTIQAMEWLLTSRLLVVGTVVYFDDWRRAGEGMKKAYALLTRQYGLQWKVLGTRNGRDDYLQQLVSCSKCGGQARSGS